MKKKILLLSNAVLMVVVFCACDKGEKHPPVITNKNYFTYGGSLMPKGLCRYWYNEYDDYRYETEFQDSCNKYNIGDTIIGCKK